MAVPNVPGLSLLFLKAREMPFLPQRLLFSGAISSPLFWRAVFTGRTGEGNYVFVRRSPVNRCAGYQYRKDKTLQISALRREKANPKTDWRRAVNANRWFRLACETPVPEPASEKYEQIANPAVRLRQR